MNTSTKHIATLILVIGVVATPTFAFESTASSEQEYPGLAAASINSPAPYRTELQKIAEQVRGWNPPEHEATERDQSTDLTSSDERFEEPAPFEESQEIKKLDSVFFDYVMAKYIERVRRS